MGITTKKLTQEEFIKKANIKHNNKYDYSNAIFTLTKNKIIIICPIHGKFEQRAGSHLQGDGCKLCGQKITGGNKTGKSLSHEEFMERAKKKCSPNIDLSKVKYLGMYKEVIVICKHGHGESKKTPLKILAGHGCSICAGQSNSTEKFIHDAKIYWGDKYNYSKSKYKSCNEKITVICKEHGEFLVPARYHLRGRGCSNCNESRGELRIREYLNNNNIKFKKEECFATSKTPCKNPNTGGFMFFDFYLPDFNLLIEFDGRQHFIPFSFSSDKSKKIQEENLANIKYRDGLKDQYASMCNIKLLRIPYTDFYKIDRILDKELGDK